MKTNHVVYLQRYDSHSHIFVAFDDGLLRDVETIGHFRDHNRARKVALAISFLLNCKLKEKRIHAT